MGWLARGNQAGHNESAEAVGTSRGSDSATAKQHHKERGMAPLPPDLQKAIEKGRLTEAQLRELITLEAKALDLDYAEAVKRARERRLPKNHIGADLELLVDLLPT